MNGPITNHGAEPFDLGNLRMNKRLPAKAGIDRHDTDQIDHVEQVAHILDARRRVARQTGLGALRADRLQGAVNMRACLKMGGDHICTRLGIGLNVRINGRDHQMDIHHRLHMGAKRLHGGRAKGEVGHEMPVHDIHVNPIRALRLNRADLSAEIGKIRR